MMMGVGRRRCGKTDDLMTNYLGLVLTALSAADDDGLFHFQFSNIITYLLLQMFVL